MFEILRWVSIAFMWLATAANIWALLKCRKAEKRWEELWRDLGGRPPVKFCYECEYYDRATVNDKGFLICPASGMDITAHDYCSYCEPKKQEGLTSEEK